MTLASIPLMDRTGRRTLHLYGLGGMFIFSIFITISFLIKASLKCGKVDQFGLKMRSKTSKNSTESKINIFSNENRSESIHLTHFLANLFNKNETQSIQIVC